MFKNFYGFLTNQQLRYSLDRLFGYLSTAEEYEKVFEDARPYFGKEDGCILTDVYKTEPMFFRVKGEANTCVVFYENLFFIFASDNKLNDKIVQIYVKRPEDEWKIPYTENEELDLLNPSNVKVEVYVNYDVSVQKLNRRLTRCTGEEYRDGVWNKMFYRSFNSFVKKVEDYTELNQINHAYGK